MQGQYSCETEKKEEEEERTKGRAEFAGFSILHLPSWYWLEGATGRSQQELRLPWALQGIHFFDVVPFFFLIWKFIVAPHIPPPTFFSSHCPLGKPFSCLRLQGIGAGKRSGGVHQTSLALSISGTFHMNGICGCKRELEMEHSRGSEGGRGQSAVYSGLAKRVCIQKDGVGFLTSEPETAMSQWSIKRVIWTLIVMAKNEREKNPGASLEVQWLGLCFHIYHILTHLHIYGI